MKFIQKFCNRKWKYDAKKSMNNASKMFRVFESNVRIEIINANFEIRNEIDQSKIQNYIQCENAKFEKFLTMYDDLNKFRNILFFVVRFAINFVCVFHTCRRCKQFFDFNNFFINILFIAIEISNFVTLFAIWLFFENVFKNESTHCSFRFICINKTFNYKFDVSKT